MISAIRRARRAHLTNRDRRGVGDPGAVGSLSHGPGAEHDRRSGFQQPVGLLPRQPEPSAPRSIIERLQELDERRIQDMDATRHRHADPVAHLARRAGVRRRDRGRGGGSEQRSARRAVRKYPTRFAGLAAVAPQNPKEAAKELERGVRKLGLKGAVINSHTTGEYLDDPKFWDIFAAAEALDVPIYIHPNSAAARADRSRCSTRGLDGAIYGFGVDTGMHLLRHHHQRRLRPLPEAEDRGRPHGRGAAVLAVPPRLHAPRHGELQALRRHEAAEEEGQRLHARKRVHHQQRRRLGAGDPVLPAGAGRRSRAVRDGLPLPVRGRGSRRDGAREPSASDQKKFYQTNAEKVFGL